MREIKFVYRLLIGIGVLLGIVVYIYLVYLGAGLISIDNPRDVIHNVLLLGTIGYPAMLGLLGVVGYGLYKGIKWIITG